MEVVAELRKDLDELQSFLNAAERVKVKDILTVEVHKLKSEVIRREAALNQENETPNPSEKSIKEDKPVRQTTVIPTVQEKTYAWDQSNKFMKIYANLSDVHTLPKENITCEYTGRSFRLKVSNLKNKNHEWHVSRLMEEIVPSESYFKVKTDMVLLMLKKRTESVTWAYVTEREQKEKEAKKPSYDEKKDPNESLMDMLKQMYEDGDDDMKRTIGKAWTESRNKTGADPGF